MRHKRTDVRKVQRIWFGFILPCASLLFLVGNCREAAAQQYYDSFSKMLSITSTMQNNLYTDLTRINGTKGAMREISGGSRITQQEIQNLCKPFPCGNEGIVNSGRPSYPVAPQSAPVYVPQQYPITATDFRPLGGRLLPDQLSEATPGNAETKEQMRTLSNQFLDAFEKEGRKNNVANAFAFLTSVSIQIVGNRELSALEEQQLTSGFNNWLASMPQFAAMSARDRQVLTESAVISGGLIALLHVQGKQQNDAKMQAESRQMARSVIAYFFGVQVQ